jgi:hypothetical protein
VIWVNPEGWKYKKAACCLHRNELKNKIKGNSITKMKLNEKWYNISF